MTIRIPIGLVWSLLVITAVGAGATAGAAGYRFGPYADLEMQLTTSLAAVRTLEENLASARHALEGKKAELTELQRQLTLQRNTNVSLNSDLSAARSSLGTTQSQLAQARRQTQRQSSTILTQERDIYILRSCLRGVVVSLNYVLEEDYEPAVDALRRVDRECRAASRLM